MIDLRGHGQSQSARMTYGVNEADDVLGAIDWLVQQGFQRQHIGLFGASMGGASAIGAISQDLLSTQKSIGALVTDSTYADFNAVMTKKFKRLSGLPNSITKHSSGAKCVRTVRASDVGHSQQRRSVCSGGARHIDRKFLGRNAMAYRRGSSYGFVHHGPNCLSK
jgi:pimeloyl-ACP methyl ester carboxylesterase